MCMRRLGGRKEFNAQTETFVGTRHEFHSNLDLHIFNHQAPSICRTCYAYVTRMLHPCCAHVTLMLQPRAKTRLIAIDWCDSDHYHDRIAVCETCPTCAGCGKVPQRRTEWSDESTPRLAHSSWSTHIVLGLIRLLRFHLCCS